MADRAGFVAAAGLSPDEAEALMGDGFDELVDVGAHPLLALSSRQVVRLEQQSAS